MKSKIVLFISILSIITSLLIPNVYYTISYAQATRVSDEQLIARAINGEARGEPYEGQVAVGAVILNRVASPDFPNTVAGVIYQPGAFTAVSDGQINVPIDPDSTVVKAARMPLTDGILPVAHFTTGTLKQLQVNGYGAGR